jgi:predicted RNA-binding protein with RPS1 domain
MQFEYNGEKLHKRQQLTAKVIGIDEKNGIQLSLKQVK